MRDLDKTVARMNATRLKGAKVMWYAVAMDTLLDMYRLQDSVARDDLKAELARRRDALDPTHPGHELMRIGYDEAIAQLTDPISEPSG